MKSTKITEIACYVAYVTQAIILNLLPLFFVIFQTDYDISASQLSLTVFLTFFVQIGIDFLVAYIGERANLRILAVLAHVMAASGPVLLAILPGVIDPFAGIIIAVVLYSVGSGLIEVMINPLFDRLPQKESKGFSFAHSFYCWGQMGVILISTLALFILDGAWRIVPLLWAIIPAVNAIALAFAPIPEKDASKEGGSAKHSKKQKFGKFSMLLLIAVMICAGASEQGVAQWASYFAEKGLGTGKLLGDLLGPCMFAFFMAIGRTLFSVLGKRIDITKALTACAVATSVCHFAIALIPSPILSLTACALCGLTVSIMWPATLDLASSSFYCGTAAFSLLSVAGDIGCTVGPSVNGVVSDLFSTTALAEKLGSSLGLSAEQIAIRLGFLLDSVFPIIMIFMLLTISKKLLCGSKKTLAPEITDGK